MIRTHSICITPYSFVTPSSPLNSSIVLPDRTQMFLMGLLGPFSSWSHQDHTLQDLRSSIIINEWCEKTVELLMPMSLKTDTEYFRHQVSTEKPPFCVSLGPWDSHHGLPLVWPCSLLHGGFLLVLELRSLNLEIRS